MSWVQRRDGLGDLNFTGLKTSHYGRLIRRLFGSWSGPLGFARGKREAVVVIGVDGVADGFSPAVGAENVDVFVLGHAHGLEQGLGKVGYGAGGSGFYVAADDGGDEASQGGGEITGGEVVSEKK